MSFDYSKALNVVKNTTPKQTSNETEYKYRLIYPSEGVLNVRILFNPKSGLITRLISRHNIGGTKVPCMATYSSKSDCPVCKVLANAEELGIKVPFTSKSKVRAIMYAQYHSSSYEIDKVKKGDIVLLMVPWKIYQDISKFINDVSASTESLDKAFNETSYFAFTIEKGPGNQDWSGRINPVITVDSGCSTHEEFEKMLDDIDSLYTAIGHIHETPTEEDMEYINEAAAQLRKQLIEGGDETSEESEGPTIPTNPNKEPETMDTAFNAPDCYGKKYVPEDDTSPANGIQRIKCKVCAFKDGCKLQISK